MRHSEKAWSIWFAGFMDGEGHLGIHPHAYRKNGKIYRTFLQIELEVGQRLDRAWILDEIANKIGGTVTRSNQMSCIVWSRRKAIKIIRERLHPFARLKKEQYKIFLEGIGKWNHQDGNAPLTPETIAYRQKFANSVNSFNLKYTLQGKPSQDPEPVNEGIDG